MRRLLRAVALAGLATLVGCPKPPRPAVFSRVDETRARADVARAQADSPQTWSKGEGLRARAEEALAKGDRQTAELLAEQAIAAYAHAAAMARRLDAAGRKQRELDRRARADERLVADERARVEIDREADRMEAELSVRKEALAPVASGPADAKRQAARWVVVRSNLAAADVLCEAARVLAPQAKGGTEARKIVVELQARASGQGEPPIDASTRARALCLKALTAARDVVVNGGGATGDALAKDLQALGLATARDERGVVITLPQGGAAGAPFEGAKLAAAGKTQLDAIAKQLKAYPQYAVVVVVHAAPGAVDAARDGQRATAAKQTLSAAGVDGARIGTQTPGAALPAYDPADAKLKAKNERLEIVLVGPR